MLPIILFILKLLGILVLILLGLVLGVLLLILFVQVRYRIEGSYYERLKGKVLLDKEYKEGARFVFVLPVKKSI